MARNAARSSDGFGIFEEVLGEGVPKVFICCRTVCDGFRRELRQAVAAPSLFQVRLRLAVTEILEDEAVIERSAINRRLPVKVLRDDQFGVTGRPDEVSRVLALVVIPRSEIGVS